MLYWVYSTFKIEYDERGDVLDLTYGLVCNDCVPRCCSELSTSKKINAKDNVIVADFSRARALAA